MDDDPQNLALDPPLAAEQAGLHYLSDAIPGIRRVRAGEGFSYVDAAGKAVADPFILDRIRSLAIPPAWTDVWICPHAEGHLQATGRDARGRKQYRYHSRWREVRDENKFGRMLAFGRALPAIRARVEQDMARRGLPREKVLATIVQLMETTLIRVGNEEYARENQSFGATTLRDRHVDVSGETLRLKFRAKSGKVQNIRLRDRRLARIVKRCQDLPGQELFQYIDEDGTRRTVGSSDVNEYLHDITGQDFTAKDFRTWAGTVLAALALQGMEAASSPTAAKRTVKQAIENVAARLGNTPAICRKCYVHPEVIAAYLDGGLLEAVTEAEADGLSDDEAQVMAFLDRRLARPLAALSG